MITVITIITAVAVVLTGYSLGYVTGRFYNNGVTKDYLTEVATQTSNKIIRDIRCGLNGVRNAVDDNIEKTVKVDDFLRWLVQTHIKVMGEVQEVEETSEVQEVKETSEDNWDWSDLEVDKFLDPKPEIYHNQEIKLSSQTEKALRISIDSLWQKAYVNCLENETEEAYKELGRVHRQLSAIILKAQKGKNI